MPHASPDPLFHPSNPELLRLTDSILGEVVALRRHLHRHPELSYREVETTRLLVERLKSLGLEVHQPLDTGCVAVLRGGANGAAEPGIHPSGAELGEGPLPVTAFRADIDALPIQEEGESKSEFLSTVPGVAHCCGHDAHTANLMGVATLLAEMRDRLCGTIVFIFQPGEEKLPGGGRLLMESGVLRRLGVQRIYGLHTAPLLPVGTVATRPGYVMARPDEIEIVLRGKGGHAAAPHLCVDPIVMGAQLVQQLQTVVSRHSDPLEPVVLTIGSFHAGSAHNVIPASAELKGTVRTFSRETAMKVKADIARIVDGVAAAAGGSGELLFNEGYPAVVNDEELTRGWREAAVGLLGSDRVFEMERPVMGGEDFAFYQQEIPGVFFFLGTASEQADSAHSWHHPRYNIDEGCFRVGIPLMTTLALHHHDSSAA